MKKQNLTKTLHKPVHPMLGKVVLGAGILLAAGALAFLLQRGPLVSPSTNTPPPTKAVATMPTSVPTQQVAMYTPMPTSTLAPGQKAIYTFYIQATSHETSPKGFSLKQSDTGKTFTVDVGTFISLDFGVVGKFHVSLSSPQNIFKCVGSECLPHSSPENSITSFWVSRAGYGTITVTETE